MPILTYTCKTQFGLTRGVAGTKKDAKTIAAHAMLKQVSPAASSRSSAPSSPARATSPPAAPAVVVAPRMTSPVAHAPVVNQLPAVPCLPTDNPINELNEWCHARRAPNPIYQIESQDGPPHQTIFTISCQSVQGKTYGTAPSSKDAKREAAENMLRLIQKETGYTPRFLGRTGKPSAPATAFRVVPPTPVTLAKVPTDQPPASTGAIMEHQSSSGFPDVVSQLDAGVTVARSTASSSAQPVPENSTVAQFARREAKQAILTPRKQAPAAAVAPVAPASATAVMGDVAASAAASLAHETTHVLKLGNSGSSRGPSDEEEAAFRFFEHASSLKKDPSMGRMLDSIEFYCNENEGFDPRQALRQFCRDSGSQWTSVARLVNGEHRVVVRVIKAGVTVSVSYGSSRMDLMRAESNAIKRLFLSLSLSLE